ncbi:hypothetical protein C923_05894 [Plasmodium falciparum UGT5.1]|nr:hypothetical protein C923_05894 [Plasmodium falciparum UGT5.1]
MCDLFYYSINTTTYILCKTFICFLVYKRSFLITYI